MFFKIGVLKNFAIITRKYLYRSLFFNKVANQKASNFIKKRLQHSCFTVNIAKFLRAPFYLLLNINKFSYFPYELLYPIASVDITKTYLGKFLWKLQFCEKFRIVFFSEGWLYITATGNILANGSLCFRVLKLQLKIINKNICYLYSVWVNQIS